MNALVESMISRELLMLRQGVVLELEQTLGRFRPYSPPSIEEQAERFARAEVEVEDPLRSTQHAGADVDPYGIEAAFANPLER
jgi:hypothetical protein